MTYDKLIVYTCITNGKDELKTMPKSDRVRYVCFSDQPFEHEQWEYQPLQWKESNDSRRIARWHKINSHLIFPDCYTLWIDGNITLNFRPHLLLHSVNAHGDIVSKIHPVRDCVYQEFEAVRMLRYDDLEVLAEQEALYRSENFPEKAGLPETNILFRKPTQNTRDFNNLWWNMISRYSKRDQLSFTYCTWKLGLKWDKFPVDTVNVHRHSKKTTDKQ